MTTERDSTQKRHGFTYFSKGTYFVLVEDMRQELATIAAAEYAVRKGRDGQEKPSWPILYCHPLARGPFMPYDEREEQRRERADKADRLREQERARRKARLREEERRRQAQAQAQATQHELRRSVSMHNLHRRASLGDVGFARDGFVDLDADFGDGDTQSANASGYLASGAYMAASGNSVGITSTTGTTSAAGNTLRNLQLPPGLRGRVQQQVVTSRRVVSGAEGKEKMGPPPNIPEKQHLLRKSRSTNTLRLPKREEGVKPGYCESCRVKFEDFKQVRWLALFAPRCAAGGRVRAYADEWVGRSISTAAGIASTRWTIRTSLGWTRSSRACAAARRVRQSRRSAGGRPSTTMTMRRTRMRTCSR